ncbi:MAG: ABC transporter permease [Clostridiales bacterium]|nr:ABC transporter permease [Clostridiales bacterium]
MSKTRERFLATLGNNKVVVLFVALCILAIIASKKPMTYVAGELFTRIGRNGFTVLALLIPVLAGMGLNFGIVIGAIAAQIAVFFTVYWGFAGIEGFLLCLCMTTVMAIFFGWLVGRLFNKMKGAEMIAGMVLGYFADGLYQLFFLYIIGGVIPMNPASTLLITGGVGVKNTVDLASNLKYSLDTVSMLTLIEVVFYAIVLIIAIKFVIRFVKKTGASVKSDLFILGAAVAVYAATYIPVIERFLATDRLGLLDGITGAAIVIAAWQMIQIVRRKLIEKDPSFKIGRSIAVLLAVALLYAATYIRTVETVLLSVNLPATTYACIAALCLFNNWLLKTRLGQSMRTVGQSRTIANAAGINVDRTRVTAMVLSTVLASWGQLIYLQNIGTFSTYGAHTQVGQFAIAALLVGGASVQQANNKQAIIGVILFHTLFIVAPTAGQQLFNNAQLGEYFRVFVAYGVIAMSLAMHAWKTHIKPKLSVVNTADKPQKRQPPLQSRV